MRGSWRLPTRLAELRLPGFPGLATERPARLSPLMKYNKYPGAQGASHNTWIKRPANGRQRNCKSKTRSFDSARSGWPWLLSLTRRKNLLPFPSPDSKTPIMMQPHCRTVLIVEDDQDIRESFRDVLEN